MSQLLLFDIDGVIRDVAGSYRKPSRPRWSTTAAGCRAQRPLMPSKARGVGTTTGTPALSCCGHGADLPERQALIEIFSGFYFGGDPDGVQRLEGFIRDEPLLVSADFFRAIDQLGWTWGFVGAKPPSADSCWSSDCSWRHRPDRHG